MKVVVIGGTGLIGSKVVAKLDQHGHDAFAAAPERGINSLTGEGVTDALAGAQVVVDVSNSPSFDDGPAWDFFTTATRNLLAADDVATAVAHIAVGHPVGGVAEVAGPDRYPLDELVRERLRASGDTLRVVTDPQSRYFGVVLDEHTLVPADTATRYPTRFADWLVANAAAPVR